MSIMKLLLVTFPKQRIYFPWSYHFSEQENKIWQIGVLCNIIFHTYRVRFHHFSVLAWKIPWTEEPGGLPSTGLQRVEGFPGSSTGKKSACNEEILVSFLGQEDLLENGVLSLVFLGFPSGSAGKESARNVGDLGSILGLGRFPGEGNSYPLQYSGLKNSIFLK